MRLHLVLAAPLAGQQCAGGEGAAVDELLGDFQVEVLSLGGA